MKIKCAVVEWTDEDMKGYRAIRTEAQISDSIVRISEFVDVDFPDRNKDEILPELLNAVDKEIKKEEYEHNEKMYKLKAKRAELLCIDFKG